MLKTLEQIQDSDKLYVLKELWDAPTGMGSGLKMINNRWFIPITHIAEVCGMSIPQVLEEHLFASNIHSQAIGHMDFIKAKASLKGYDLKAIAISSLIYENGQVVYADVTGFN